MRIHTPGQRWLCGVVVSGFFGSVAMADTTLTGAGTAAFALNSGGTTSGTSTTLSQDGYVGTYVSLAAPGAISFSINASGGTPNGVASDMTVSIADSSQSFTVGSATAGTYSYTSPVMPAGTYFVRTQLDNSKTVLVGNTPVSTATTLKINSMTVSGNATVLNTSTDANAIAASNTYIDNFRKGSATVALAGVAPGTAVQIKLVKNAFQIGTYVPGNSTSDINSYLASNPAAGTTAANFQSFISQSFNALVPSNVGKWSDNEATPGNVDMSAADAVLTYAKTHNMDVRMHNLIWGNQQPAFVQTDLVNANSANPATAAAGKAALTAAITSRINYYIKGIAAGTGDARGNDFVQLDGLNEALLTGSYYTALGPSGIAAIYKQTVDALTSVGSSAKLYTNEYNVLQNSAATVTPSSTYGKIGTSAGSDQYANWYRQEVENLNNAAYTLGAKSNVVSGIGSQYYPTSGAIGPSVVQKALQNLSVEGLPISLTEFGVQSALPASSSPQIMDDAIRMMMGNPNVTTFMYWGWWAGATDNLGSSSTLVNADWKNADGTWDLTAAGKRFEYLFGLGLDPTAPGANPDGSNPDPWTTNLSTTVNADGTINFKGFYGDYLVTIDGKQYNLSLDKGTDNAHLTLAVPEPAALTFVGAGLLSLIGVARFRRIEMDIDAPLLSSSSRITPGQFRAIDSHTLCGPWRNDAAFTGLLSPSDGCRRCATSCTIFLQSLPGHYRQSG